MKILDDVLRAQGGRAIDGLARSVGADRASTEAAVAAIVPELTRAIERNSLSRGGLADLVKALGSGQHERYLDDPTAIGDPNVRETGNRILWHLVGEKDKSRGIANRVARESGLDAEAIKQILPYVAAMTMGGLAKETKVGFGDILSKIPNLGGDGWGSQRGAGQGQGGGFPMPQPGSWPQQQGQAPGQGGGFDTGGGFGGGTSGGGIGQQMPLPVPGDIGRGGYGGGTGGGGYGGGVGMPGGRNPLEDLSDILRRGGGAGGMGGNVLWSIVRSILGGAAGFNGGGGIMSWIIRTVVMRYGWTILSTILRRAILGR
jgi:hypothetical protein